MLNLLNSFATAATTTSISEKIADWAVRVMEHLGGPGAALLIALENLFPPLPSEIILPLAGFTANQGNLNYFGAVIWTTIGSVAGALALYYLGLWLGRDRIRHYANKLPLVKLSDVDKAEDWFIKHENKAVLLGRMVPIVRSLISIPAGVERMKLKIFITYTAIGSAIWNTVLISAGYLLGEQWGIVEQYVGIFQYIVLIAIALFIGRFIYIKINAKKR